MPISTFSSAHPARHHSRLTHLWDLTGDRIDANERPWSMRAMRELDRSGLYDRPDWPLPSPPAVEVEEEQEDDGEAQSRMNGGKGFMQHGVSVMDDEHSVDDGAVLRNPLQIGEQFDGTAYLEKSDVSDMEADSDDSENERDLNAASTSHYLPKHNNVNGISPPETESTSRRELTAPHHEGRPDVSPVREPSVSHDKGSRNVDHSSIPFQHQRQETVHVELNGQAIQEDGNGFEGTGGHATSTPGAVGSPSPQPLQQQQGTASTSMFSNGNNASWSPPRMNVANPRSSISQGSTLSSPHRRVSTRSSWINTTQIPHNKDRVRYSWQSLQDDEPNRPRIHIIKLISNTATASAGFPTGEAFGFSISPGGRRIAAYNSARLYVLQTNALPVGITQDYALKRRPQAVELSDEGNTMAILADDHTVNVYDLGLTTKRSRTIKLDFPANCITLAPTGGLLAAAYEGGVEIFSLAASALPTDRRAVRSPKMDRLSFSDDGSTLLGTTTRINVSSTVVVSVPVFPAAPNGIPTHEELKEAWCSDLLHPENIRNSSHATFMREDRQTSNERVFAWNGLEDTFGILNVNDMQYGKIDFPVVISPPLSTCGGLGAAIHSCPAIDENGDTVAMIVNDRTIRLYIVPHGIDEDATNTEAHSIDHELDEGYGCPFHEVRWVHSTAALPAPTSSQTGVKGRLIVTSPGGVAESGVSDESVEDIEGGRIIMFDFDPQFAGQPGQTFSLTLGKSPPQTLEEEQVNVAEQVALVRRRTVNQSKSLSQRPAQLGRAAMTYNGRSLRNGNPALSHNPDRPNRASMLSIGSMQSDASRSLPDLLEANEVGDGVQALEEPYVQGAPRSQASLQRAATNAQRHRFQALEERQQEQVSNESPSNFLALPEYTEEPNAPLPNRYRAMAGLDGPALFSSTKPGLSVTQNGSMASSSSMTPHTAPPDIGENFSADLAFRAANAQAAAIRDTTMEQTADSAVAQSHESTPTSASASQPETLTTAAAVDPAQPSAHGTLDSVSTPLGNGTYNSFAPPAHGTYNDRETTDSRDYRASMYGGTGTSYPRSPPGRMGPYDSFSSMPRSLQRAYSNAIAPMTGPPPRLIGDWRNVSPIVGSANGISPRPPLSSAGESMQEDEPWDLISPVASRASRYGQPYGNPYRYSSPSLNPTEYGLPMRPPSSAGSYSTTVGSNAPSATGERRMPPHMQAFRQAAAANASASLFPPNQPPDHVPIRQNTVRAGTVAHPITAWHPPAPSAPSSTANLRSSGSMRGRHSRRNSLAGRSAFASTAKAKKLGFFKKSRRPDPFAPSAYNGREGGSVMETKSIFTTFTRSDGRCCAM